MEESKNVKHAVYFPPGCGAGRGSQESWRGLEATATKERLELPGNEEISADVGGGVKGRK